MISEQMSTFTVDDDQAEALGLLFAFFLTEHFNNLKCMESIKCPVLFIHGKKDEVIDYNFTLKAHQKLNELGFQINFELSDNLGHGIDDQGLKLGENFIKNIFYV